MTAVGFGMAWLGYAVGMYGYVLVKGYNVTFGQLVHPKNYYQGTWPPGPIPAGATWPTGTASATSTDAKEKTT